MTEPQDQQGLSPDFNIKLKKNIKRNLLYKNIITITLWGVVKSAVIIFITLFSAFTPNEDEQK